MVSLAKLALVVAAAAMSLVSADPIGSIPEAAEELPAVEAPYNATLSYRATPMTENKLLGKRDGELYCGSFASAEFYDGHDLALSLAGDNAKYTALAHGCKRVRCKNTSGVYFCNDRNTALTLTGNDVNNHVHTIFDRCCIHNVYGQLNNQKQSGGQQFTDALGGNWNVIVGYANCNHADTRIPSSYNGGTVNGHGCLPASIWIGTK